MICTYHDIIDRWISLRRYDDENDTINDQFV